MYNINQNYQKAINAPSRRIRGLVTIKNKVLSDGVSSIDYISSITGNEMSIGSTNASTVDVKFKTLIEGLQERELIKVSFTIETESGLVERQIGEFYLTEIKLDRNNKTTAVKAVDKMGFLNDNYNSKLHYPVSARAVLEEIISETNLRIKPSLTITNAPIILNKLEKVTYREVLGYLAQLNGAFVVFNNNGELEFRKLTRTEKRISKSAYLLKGLEIDEVEYRINGIIADLKDKAKTVFAVGSALGTQIRLTNPYMTNPHLSSIFDEYKKLRFNPFSLNWRGDPFVEVGDWVSIEVSNGIYKAFPILSLKISFSGGLKSTISANVKGTASLTTEYKGTVQRQIEFINARLGSTGNLVYADTTEPKNPSEGDVWFKPNGAFTDLYIFEKGKWVLKTSTGDVEGVVTQITKSEILTKNFAAAIAKIIELDANRITTGSLSFERLSSKAVNSIREGLVTEEKLNDFVVNNEGLHQTLASEVKKEFESKKTELKGKDGVNSYIHKKYSNNANGLPMSDNSNSKYIGIYTGASKTPPTNASEYSWTKIAEDNELINESIKKFKTFESTLDRFENKLSEVNRKGFKMGYTITNICSNGNIEKRENGPTYNLKKSIIGNKYYYVLATLTDVPLDQAAGIWGSNPSSIKPIYNGLNLWRMRFTYNVDNFQMYPMGATTRIKSVEVYEVPNIEPVRENILSYFNEQKAKRGELSVSVRENLTKGAIYTLEFAINSNVPKNSYLISKFTGFGEVKLPLSPGVNKYTFSPTSDISGFIVWIPENLTITNVGIFKEQIKTGYRTEYNESEIDSKITQSLSGIELSLTQRINNANSTAENLKTSIRLMQGRIDNVVTKGEFGTTLTQNAQYLKLAWNNISKYIQFENGGLSFYEGGVVTQDKLTARITDNKYSFWRDGYKLGHMGTNEYINDNSQKGIVFDLDVGGSYMTWAYKSNSRADSYTMKWTYAAKDFGGYSANTLNAGCDIEMNWNYLHHVKFDLNKINFNGGAVSSTLRFALADSYDSDGTAGTWHNDCYMVFKNGILIDCRIPT